jgi:hypothetical protein
VSLFFRVLVLTLVLAGLAGCGDAIVDEAYRGEALATFQANSVDGNSSAKHLRSAVFWSTSRDETDVSKLKEQVSTSEPVVAGKSVRISLFEQPETLLPWNAAEPDGAHFALGRLLLYDDANDNGRRDANEPVLGGMLPYGLVYAPEDLPAGVGPARIALKKGLHSTWLPLHCEGERPPPPGLTACQPLELFAACKEGMEASADCGPEGQCIDRFQFPWPEGACLVSEEVCRPENGRILHGGPDMSFYTKACETDADCGRANPYRCDPLQGACVPYNLPLVEETENNRFPPFCAGEPP